MSNIIFGLFSQRHSSGKFTYITFGEEDEIRMAARTQLPNADLFVGTALSDDGFIDADKREWYIEQANVNVVCKGFPQFQTY